MVLPAQVVRRSGLGDLGASYVVVILGVTLNNKICAPWQTRFILDGRPGRGLSAQMIALKSRCAGLGGTGKCQSDSVVDGAPGVSSGKGAYLALHSAR